MNTIIGKIKSIVEFSKIKCIVGCVLALAVLVVCALYYSLAAGCVFAVGIIAVGCFRLKGFGKIADCVLNAVYTAFCVFLIFFIACKVMYPDFFPHLSFLTFNLNVLCVLIVSAALFVFIGNVRASLSVSAALLMILSVVDYFVFALRDREFAPSDIFTATTVMNVAGQYKLELPAMQAYFLIVLAILIFAQYSLPKWPALPKIKSRVIALASVIVMLIVLKVGSINVPYRTWQSDGSFYNGYYLNFYLGLDAIKVDEPDGYSAEAVEEISSDYKVTNGSDAKKSPNVIIIMNESFADFNIFGESLATNKAVTPFIDSLKENTVRGYALASVYGGNTANSEFELLTGHTMGFLPEMSVPYQQYLSGSVGSFVHQMNYVKYSNLATHPFKASGWNRVDAYSKLGFEKSTFEDDYPQKELIRAMISDREMYGYVLDALEDKKDNAFLFGITMQNHGNYDYTGADFVNTISIKGSEGKYPLAEQYLSLIHETDKATEEFIGALKEYPEDTVVLFFGDHLPKVENELYEKLAGGPLDTLDRQQMQYTVPFFIWANYDIEEAEVELTSLNYLSRYLLDAAGMELPPYYQFLADVEREIPAINAKGYYSKSQKKFLTFDEAEGREKEWLDKYEAVQYNNLFDDDNRNENFFAKYIPEEK